MVRPSDLPKLLPGCPWDATELGWLLKCGLVRGQRLHPGCLIDPESVEALMGYRDETEGRKGGARREAAPPTAE
jgi:hypothetical protein